MIIHKLGAPVVWRVTRLPPVIVVQGSHPSLSGEDAGPKLLIFPGPSRADMERSVPDVRNGYGTSFTFFYINYHSVKLQLIIIIIETYKSYLNG